MFNVVAIRRRITFCVSCCVGVRNDERLGAAGCVDDTVLLYQDRFYFVGHYFSHLRPLAVPLFSLTPLLGQSTAFSFIYLSIAVAID